MINLKVVVSVVLLFCTSLTLQANGESNMSSNVVVKGIKPEKGGNLVFMVFNEEGFPKDHAKAIVKKQVSPNANKMIFDVALPDGEFALKVHHDENSDGKVTKNWTKIFPKEGLAFSNGARIRFGPPSFKSAKILKGEDDGIEMEMLYP